MFNELKALEACGIPLVTARNYTDRQRGGKCFNMKADMVHSLLDSHVWSMACKRIPDSCLWAWKKVI